MHIGPVPFDELGFNTKLPNKPVRMAAWSILKEVPNVAVLVFLIMSGTYYLYRRRAEVEAAAKEKEEG